MSINLHVFKMIQNAFKVFILCRLLQTAVLMTFYYFLNPDFITLLHNAACFHWCFILCPPYHHPNL